MQYYLLKVKGNDGRIVAAFESLFFADRHFVEGSALESVADWVEELGCYPCNAADFDTSGELDVLIDSEFEVPDSPNDFEVQEYNRYRAVLDRLLRQMVS